jgi:hypothetical protein
MYQRASDCIGSDKIKTLVQLSLIITLGMQSVI